MSEIRQVAIFWTHRWDRLKGADVPTIKGQVWYRHNQVHLDTHGRFMRKGKNMIVKKVNVVIFNIPDHIMNHRTVLIVNYINSILSNITLLYKPYSKLPNLNENDYPELFV